MKIRIRKYESENKTSEINQLLKKMRVNKLHESIQDELFMDDIDNISKDFKIIDAAGWRMKTFE